MSIIRILFVLIILLLVSCTINEPKLPEWDTSFKVHLPTQDFKMEELINDSTLVGANDQGTPIILIQIEDSTDWERIKQNDLVLEPQNDHYNSEIGEINLGDYDDMNSDSVSVLDILPPGLISAGDTLIPFDSVTVYPPGSILEYSEYRSANVKEGQLWLTFHNRMFLSVREGMIINVYNENGTSGLIQEIVFNEPIPAGSSVVSDPINLSDQFIHNKFRLEYIIPIAGSDTFKVLSQEDRDGFFYTVLSVDEFIVDFAEAMVPAQSFESTDAIDISDQTHQIINARVEKGSISFQIQNKLALDTEVNLELPNFVKNGQPKRISHHLFPAQDDVFEIDLAGWEITNYKEPGSIITTIDYNVLASIDSSDGFITINATDSILIDVATDSFYVSSFTGVLDTVSFEVDPVKMDDIDLPDELNGEIRLNDLAMYLKFQNEIDLPIEINLEIAGYRDDEANPAGADSVIIAITEHIQPAGISEFTTIVLDQNYSEPSIVDLLAILPNEISISGEAKVYGEGSVEINEGLRVLYKMESPLNFEITKPVTFDTDVDSITNDDLGEDERDKLVNDLSEMNAEFTFINHAPIGASVKFIMAIDSLMLFDDEIPDSSKKIIIEADVNPGLAGADGYVENPNSENVLSLRFTDRQLDIFNYTPLYTRQEVVVKPTNGFVKIRQTDRIEIEAVLDAKITVNTKD